MVGRGGWFCPAEVVGGSPAFYLLSKIEGESRPRRPARPWQTAGPVLSFEKGCRPEEQAPAGSPRGAPTGGVQQGHTSCARV